MTINEKVYSALNGSATLRNMLVKDRRGQCIYHGVSPDAGSYPIIVYSLLSDVPAVVADATEIERRVTVRIHIITKDGAYERIYREVLNIMLGIGFMRKTTAEIAEKNEFIKITDFTIGEGVDL